MKDVLRARGIVLTVEELPEKPPAYLADASRVIYYGANTQPKAKELADVLSQSTGLRFTTMKGATPPLCASHRLAIHCVAGAPEPMKAGARAAQNGTAKTEKERLATEPSSKAQPEKSKRGPDRAAMPPLGYSDEQLKTMGYGAKDIRTLRETHRRTPPYGYTREQLEKQGYTQEEIARTLGPKP